MHIPNRIGKIILNFSTGSRIPLVSIYNQKVEGAIVNAFVWSDTDPARMGLD
jgi:hypothetical protein